MSKKTIITDFRKERSRKKVLCSYCKKSNKFGILHTDSGYMVFECLRCFKKILMPFKKK